MATESESGANARRLLLVEDEYVFAVCLSDLLEALGVQVLGPVACVSDALQLIEQAPEIDGAILDINLGGEVVYPVADALLRHRVPFVFASAQERDRMPVRFAGIELCTKPTSVHEVRAMLTRLH